MLTSQPTTETKIVTHETVEAVLDTDGLEDTTELDLSVVFTIDDDGGGSFVVEYWDESMEFAVESLNALDVERLVAQIPFGYVASADDIGGVACKLPTGPRVPPRSPSTSAAVG